jgi:hypothetical protein
MARGLGDISSMVASPRGLVIIGLLFLLAGGMEFSRANSDIEKAKEARGLSIEAYNTVVEQSQTAIGNSKGIGAVGVLFLVAGFIKQASNAYRIHQKGR